MISGFQLRSLRVTGRGKDAAELSFSPGLNVISGASNTGKSYILQCIDFMLGGKTPPKPIEESAGYEKVFLTLEDKSGQLHQLERSLSGHAFRHKIFKGDAVVHEATLAERHNPVDTETISALLLSLCHAWARKIRKNQSGNTRALSFRDLSRLILVDEKRIIDDRSPVFSGQYTTKTEELSTFKLLLTGVDDESIISRESRKEHTEKQKSQLELLDRLVAELEEEISTMDEEPSSIEDRRRRLDESIVGRSEAVVASHKEIAKLEERRREAWEASKKIERRQAATIELRGRFSLLEEHYKNDLARLQAIIELDHYFSQLQQVRCPLCGASTDQHDPRVHDGQGPDQLETIRTACRAEIRKINSLLRDLVGTAAQLDEELSTLQLNYATQTSLFESATQEVVTRLAPAAQKYQIELAEVMRTRDSLAHVEMLQTRLTLLQTERSRIAGGAWKSEPKSKAVDIIPAQAKEAFSLEVQDLLADWRYPGLTRVTFSDEKFDLVVSGKERASEGKGFRAIAYAAFMVGLLEYCFAAEAELPHPGIVVLDSPLVTYKRRDIEPGEAIPEDVATAFYQSLSKLQHGKQVIVLENNDPPEDLHDKINYTHFSRSGVGRFGFFPKQSP